MRLFRLIFGRNPHLESVRARHRTVFIALFVSVLLGTLFCSSTQAEWYVGGQVGVGLPDALSNVHLSDPNFAGGVNNARVSDLDRTSTGVWGGKIGYFSEDREWLGLEGEIFNTHILTKQQTVVGGTPEKGVFAEIMPGKSTQLTTAALNVIIREPALSKQLNPYGGIGPALFITSGGGGGGKTHVNLGVNLLAGARYFVSDHWAVFGEFKYDRATIAFGGIDGQYSAQIFVVGLTYHFKESTTKETTAVVQLDRFYNALRVMGSRQASSR